VNTQTHARNQTHRPTHARTRKTLPKTDAPNRREPEKKTCTILVPGGRLPGGASLRPGLQLLGLLVHGARLLHPFSLSLVPSSRAIYLFLSMNLSLLLGGEIHNVVEIQSCTRRNLPRKHC
jgi:hypothetical protein